MATCLDLNACPNDKMYNVICNFSIGYNEYVCNPQTTCMRADGKYDCCGKNIVECVIYASSLQMPTIQPTISSSDIPCNLQCQPEYRIDTCHWYESKQIIQVVTMKTIIIVVLSKELTVVAQTQPTYTL